MDMRELFPGWMEHEHKFFERHENAMTTVARFMSNGNSWDVVCMWEKIIRNCAKAECICGVPWEEDMDQFGCWNCGSLTPNVLLCRARHGHNRRHGSLSRASARATS